MVSQQRVAHLSPSLPVNMGDWWFDVATIEHFWVRRRFEVVKKLADAIFRRARCIAEIGCGNGLVQRDVEDYYGLPVTGFELNELALQKNVSRRSPLYCYNIHDRKPEFRGHFDLVLLCDVLEHIDNELEFLESVKFHMAESGILLINVPAHQFLFSDYDRAAGHVRRYSLQQLMNTTESNGFKGLAFTYWGLPLVPLLLMRKAVSMNRQDGRRGFDPGSHLMNHILSVLACCEPIPQKILGTSLMAVVQFR
jgi:SAM-dependent methyltransferase